MVQPKEGATGGLRNSISILRCKVLPFLCFFLRGYALPRCEGELRSRCRKGSNRTLVDFDWGLALGGVQSDYFLGLSIHGQHKPVALERVFPWYGRLEQELLRDFSSYFVLFLVEYAWLKVLLQKKVDWSPGFGGEFGWFPI